MRKRSVVALAAVAAEACGALAWLGKTWGSTPDERRRALPSDTLVRFPHLQTDHAITIAAPPEEVWPWLVQMGWGRAGWYTYRWVDLLLFPRNGPSASEILPEHQSLAVGDEVPDGPPESGCAFVVVDVDPPSRLVLLSRTHLPPRPRNASMEWVWTYTLDRSADTTRLHLRSRLVISPRWLRALYRACVGADFIMARSHLIGIRQRAEAMRAARGDATGTEARHPDVTEVRR